MNTDKAVAVLQTLPSQQAVGIINDYPGGDPAIIAVPPVEQYRTNYVFLTPEEYAPFTEGTYILDLEENKKRFKKAEGLGSVYGSSMVVDEFNVDNQVYGKPENVDAYFDPSIVMSLK